MHNLVNCLVALSIGRRMHIDVDRCIDIYRYPPGGGYLSISIRLSAGWMDLESHVGPPIGPGINAMGRATGRSPVRRNGWVNGRERWRALPRSWGGAMGRSMGSAQWADQRARTVAHTTPPTGRRNGAINGLAQPIRIQGPANGQRNWKINL